MRGWMASPALVVALLAVPSLAQRHGASGGFAGHAGFSGPVMGHGPVMSRGPSFSGSTTRSGGGHFAGSLRPSYRSPYYSSRNRSYHRRYYNSYAPHYYGYAGGLYAYPWYYGDYGFGYPETDPDPQYDYSRAYDSQSGEMEQGKIDRLEDEVAQLRQERNSAGSASPTKTEIRASTLLVFRDQHTQDVQNYAIVGETLWVFDAQKASKIPVDDLDIPATTKANDDRGVDFRLPIQQ
ncbi:MAG: hypothetical protein WB421_09050 [Terriglobales bacterium]